MDVSKVRTAIANAKTAIATAQAAVKEVSDSGIRSIQKADPNSKNLMKALFVLGGVDSLLEKASGSLLDKANNKLDDVVKRATPKDKKEKESKGDAKDAKGGKK